MHRSSHPPRKRTSRFRLHGKKIRLTAYCAQCGRLCENFHVAVISNT